MSRCCVNSRLWRVRTLPHEALFCVRSQVHFARRAQARCMGLRVLYIVWSATGCMRTNSQGAFYGAGCSKMVARTIFSWCLHALRTQLTWLLDLQFALARSEKASNKTSMATQSWPRACGFSNICCQKTGPNSSRGYICTCPRTSLCTQTNFLRESPSNSCKICKLCTARWSYGRSSGSCACGRSSGPCA